MLFKITPDTSHGDPWPCLSNQVPDSILVLRSPLSTFHATFIAYSEPNGQNAYELRGIVRRL